MFWLLRQYCWGQAAKADCTCADYAAVNGTARIQLHCISSTMPCISVQCMRKHSKSCCHPHSVLEHSVFCVRLLEKHWLMEMPVLGSLCDTVCVYLQDITFQQVLWILYHYKLQTFVLEELQPNECLLGMRAVIASTTGSIPKVPARVILWSSTRWMLLSLQSSFPVWAASVHYLTTGGEQVNT